MTLKYFRFTTLITMASSRGGYIAYGLFIKAPRGWGVFLLPFLVVGAKVKKMDLSTSVLISNKYTFQPLGVQSIKRMQYHKITREEMMTLMKSCLIR